MRIIEGILKDSEGIPAGFRRDSLRILQDSSRFLNCSSGSPEESSRMPCGVRILYGFLEDSFRILKRFLKDSLRIPKDSLRISYGVQKIP